MTPMSVVLLGKIPFGRFRPSSTARRGKHAPAKFTKTVIEQTEANDYRPHVNPRSSFGEAALGRRATVGPCFFSHENTDLMVISGDSDLLASVKLVMEELKKPVGVLNPQKHPCRVLKDQATFYKHLRPNFIAASVFPNTMTDAGGTFTKPPHW